MKMTTSSKINLVGLNNLGHTCFMNASLQCLCHNEAFEKQFLLEPVPSGDICLQVADLCRRLTSDTQAVSPDAFKATISKYHEQYLGTEEHDAHEFLGHLLNCLHDEMKKWPLCTTENSTFIEKNFGCAESKMITCKHCGEITVYNEQVSPITSVALSTTDRTVSLLECLRNYCFGQTIEDFSCSKCHCKSEAIEKTFFNSLAPTIIIHLKRFGVVNGRFLKDKRPVNCPMEFTPQNLYWEGIPNKRYKLVSFLCHYGEGISTGHYMAYHKINERWFKFNDSVVAEVPLHEVNITFAYILFYSVETGSNRQKVTISLPRPVVDDTGTTIAPTGAQFLPSVKFVSGEGVRKNMPVTTRKTQVYSVRPPPLNKTGTTAPPGGQFFPGVTRKEAVAKIPMRTRQPPTLPPNTLQPEVNVGEPQAADEDVISTTTTTPGKMFSEYAKALDTDLFRRYLNKISVIGFVDPYTLVQREGFPKPETLPDVSFGDIFVYFVTTTSTFTVTDFKAFKSMDAYNAAICGWIKSLWIEHFSGNVLLMGKVMHSRSLSEKPLLPWVIVRESGEIDSAHCTCMAGLAEGCSHAAALLFYVEDQVRRHHNPSVTEIPAYWRGTSKKPVEFKRVQDVDFSHPLTKMERLIEAKENVARKLQQQIPILTKDEKQAFLKNLIDSNCDVASLTVTLPFCTLLKDRDTAMLANYPPALRKLYDPVYRGIPAEQLSCVGLTLDLSVTVDQAIALENATKKQTLSKKFHLYRAGRVTASKFKAVCRTNLEKPSLSLVKTVCYPDQYKFSTKATQWGCRHEKTALNTYIDQFKQSHQDFSCEDSGFIINPQYPHFGASPDGLVSCKCCKEKGCVEVKCPHCLRSKDKSDILTTKTCLVRSGDSVCLDVEHSYYFQIQMQLFVSGRDFCDFVLWTPSALFVQRIEPDQHFWDIHSKIATDFFYQVLVPEMLGRCFTQSHPSTQEVLCSPRRHASRWVVSPRQQDSSTPVHLRLTAASSPQREAWRWNVTQPTHKTPSPIDISSPRSVVCTQRNGASKWVVSPIVFPPRTDAITCKAPESLSGKASEPTSLAVVPPGIYPLPRP